MRINILQHTPNEGPGSIRKWANKHQHDLYVYHPYHYGIFPSLDETDFLILLGGPMSPNDELDWIYDERDLINRSIDRGIPILGICYGAQQIAKALGSNVYDSPHKEVGWAPVYLRTPIPNFSKQLNVLHWHEQICDIPLGAELLFSSELVKNQGFISNNIIGIQFHLEMGLDNLRELVINDGNYANHGNALLQTSKDILESKVPLNNEESLFNLLDYIITI